MKRTDIDTALKEIMATIGYDNEKGFFVCAFKAEGDEGITSCASGSTWRSIVGAACIVDKLAKVTGTEPEFILNTIRDILKAESTDAQVNVIPQMARGVQ